MLYFVASPIGNLSDITVRALEVLAKVDLIICEDTRRSAKLLNHYGIKKKLISYHQHSGEGKLLYIIEELRAGREVVYLSDAGTPNLCDPGAKLAEAAFENQIQAVPIPGPSPLSALISVAPFDCANFRFIGFFPKKKGRQTLVKSLKSVKEPVFFFESPNRIKKTILLLAENLPEKRLLVGRELTKVFEEIELLDLSKINEDNISNLPEKGEFILAIF